MGSLNEFGWLSTENVTFLQQAIETRYEIPLRLMARGFSSLIARKNFDFAQDDIQWFCLQICVRDGRFVNRPYRKITKFIGRGRRPRRPENERLSFIKTGDS